MRAFFSAGIVATIAVLLASGVPSARAASDANPLVRVAITSTAATADSTPWQLTATTAFDVVADGATLLSALKAGTPVNISFNPYSETYTVSTKGGEFTTSVSPRIITVGDKGVVEVLTYQCPPGFSPKINDNRFRGAVEIVYSPTSQKVWAVNELPLEQYMLGIAEIPNGKPAEHMKVMATGARSYALYHVRKDGKYKEEVFHVKNSVCSNGDDQLYRGYNFETRARRGGGTNFPVAAEATRGMVVMYQGEVALTAYSSDSGGVAKDARKVWSDKKYAIHPYLFGMNTDGSPVKDPANTKRRTPKEIKASHGVGISSAGSETMALNGAKYQEILRHYYPGTEVSSLR